MAVLEQTTGPILAEEVMRALQSSGQLTYDGDLTDRPVSNTSTTYPGVAYGYTGDGPQLEYQAAMVSLHSPTYSRLWLSVAPHPGDTVSCTHAEALIRAAEAKTGLRPWRRTNLLRERVRAREAEAQTCQAKAQLSQAALERAQARLAGTRQQYDEQRARVLQLETHYQEHQRPERPYSALAKARQRWTMLERWRKRQEKQLHRRQQRWLSHQTAVCSLQQCLEQFEQENRINPCPIQADFRLDAGFGTRDNVALIIEMGHQLYTKPYSDWLTPRLKKRVNPQTRWTQVGGNAELVAWKAERFVDLPYPLDVGLERFQTGQTQRHGTLIHFGRDPVTTNLAGWFQRYNACQLIEAGIKEGKNVFTMHHLKVCSGPALFLQEHLAAFAAKFVRWAARWLSKQCLQLPAGWQHSAQPQVKAQVKVGAHTSA